MESSFIPCYAVPTNSNPRLEEPQRLHLQDQTDIKDSSQMNALCSFEMTVITAHSTRSYIPHTRNIFLRLAVSCHF